MTTATMTKRGRGVAGDRRTLRSLAVAGATLAGVVVWVLAEGVLGLQLRLPAFNDTQQPQELNAAVVAVFSAVGGLAAWAVLAALERFSANARRPWVAVAAIALVVSMVPPLSGHGVSVADRLVLVGMHLAVAAAVIPMLYRSSGPRAVRARPSGRASSPAPGIQARQEETP